MSLGPETSFFVLGATGYIGGAVVVAYQKAFPSATFTLFTRSAAKAEPLKKKGWKVLVSTGDKAKDLELIKDAASKVDVVVNAADADDVPLVKAILDGLEKSTIKLPIYIHTSGSNVVGTKRTGSFDKAAEKIWDDHNVDDIKSIPPTAHHRDVDDLIFNASKRGFFINYIIAPSTIYGVASDNPGHKISQQVPNLIQVSVEKKQTVIAGEGTNVWNNVHIYDMADLYVVVLEKALAERATGTIDPTLEPYERFYFSSVGEHVWGDVSRALAPILFEKGLVKNPDVVSFPVGELKQVTANNSRTVSNRGFKDGWKPNRASLLDTLKEDVEATLETLT